MAIPIHAHSKVDPRWLNVPNMVVIHGTPQHGKSNLGKALSKLDGFLNISVDSIFLQYIERYISNRMNFMAYKGRPDERFDIGKYINSEDYNYELFITFLKLEIAHKLKRGSHINTVVLEGYALKDHDKIISDINIKSQYAIVLHAFISENRYMVNEFDVTNYKYDEVIRNIKNIFYNKCLNMTLPKSRYQDFSSLGLTTHDKGKTSSKTLEKYDASHLDDVIQDSDRVVDIGCNAGYFCFRAAKKTSNVIIGVDMTSHWLEVASHINNSCFFYKNISFFYEKAWVYLGEVTNSSFEVIHCASTYHYFREYQVVFLAEAHRTLTQEGRLILEIELAPSGNEPETVMRSRKVDSLPCAFPNRQMFLQQIKGLFNIEAEYKSVFQGGSFYDRTYFHLRPIRQDTRFILDEAKGNKIRGWAVSRKSPEKTIKLLIKIRNNTEFYVQANQFRKDLLAKGIHPNGNCGFNLTLSEEDSLIPGDAVAVFSVENKEDENHVLMNLITFDRAK